MKSSTALARRFLDSCFTPPERLSKSEWSTRRRRLSSEASSKGGGRFTFDVAPWQREVIDSVDDPTVGEVVLMWASQLTGKTETLNNIVGATIEIDPCPILVLQPTVEMAQAWSKDRLATMLRDTPALRGRVKEPRTRASDNTILSKRFPGGHITIVGANSPVGLAMRPIRMLVCDEVDRYPESAGTEGDPIALAYKRTDSFPDAVKIETSSPTIKGVSRIEKSYLQSDQRKWFCKCPLCGAEQVLKWAQVKWTEHDPDTARMECDGCHVLLDDAQRRAMVTAGEWKATAKSRVRGYHLNGLVCLFPSKKPHKNRLAQFVYEFLDAKAKGKLALRVWTNTFLAETWEEEAERVEAGELAKRCEIYTPATLPSGVLVLTAGVDIQANRVCIEVDAWGAGEESWAVEYHELPGNPLQPMVWVDLDAFWRKEYKTADGRKLIINAAAVDTGGTVGMTAAAYGYLRTRFARRIYAVKGSNTAGDPVIVGSRVSSRGRIRVYRLGTDTAKSTLYGRLKQAEHGPGYMHYPVGHGFDEEYFSMLTAEEIRTTHRKGYSHREWHKTRPRNESLDCRVYSLGALTILQPQWIQLTRRVDKLRNQVEKSPDETEQPTQPDTPEPERVSIMARNRTPQKRRGGWLNSWRR